MRLISQYGYYDISYEHHNITVREPIIHCDKWKVSAFGDNSETEIVIGEYSTEEKALKVMEMIREANAPLIIMKNLDSDDLKGLESLSHADMIETRNVGVEKVGESYFYMPQDSEVDA